MVRKQSFVVCATAPLSVQRSAPSTGGFGFAHNTAVTLQYSRSLAPSPQPPKGAAGHSRTLSNLQEEYQDVVTSHI